MCMLFAATYPERTTALITLGSFAKRRDPDDDYPWAPTAENRELEALDVSGTGVISTEDVAYLAPSKVDDEQFIRHLETYFRRSASPGAAAAFVRMNSFVDVRDILPTIQVPTLVLHRTGDRDVAVDEGRYIAARIPGAKFVELAGDDHAISAGDTDALADEIEAFVTGTRPIPEPDRVLATVLLHRHRRLDAAGRGTRRSPLAGCGAHRSARSQRLPVRAKSLISQTVKDLTAGSGLEFADRGVHELKGVPGEWRLYAAV